MKAIKFGYQIVPNLKLLGTFRSMAHSSLSKLRHDSSLWIEIVILLFFILEHLDIAASAGKSFSLTAGSSALVRNLLCLFCDFT